MRIQIAAPQPTATRYSQWSLFIRARLSWTADGALRTRTGRPTKR
jgi:hypothetical protein